MINGLGGADCLLWVSKQKDWTDPLKYTNGFEITRTAASTLDLYRDLVTDDGNVERSRDDFETRKGLTKCPLTTSSQQNITITHSYINGLSWFVKMLTRCHADSPRWSHPNNRYVEILDRAKLTVTCW